MYHKIILLFAGLLLFGRNSSAQTETVIAPSNRSAVSLEKNMLFYADKRYQVTRLGCVSLSLPMLFDAHHYPKCWSNSVDSGMS